MPLGERLRLQRFSLVVARFADPPYAAYRDAGQAGEPQPEPEPGVVHLSVQERGPSSATGMDRRGRARSASAATWPARSPFRGPVPPDPRRRRPLVNSRRRLRSHRSPWPSRMSLCAGRRSQRPRPRPSPSRSPRLSRRRSPHLSRRPSRPRGRQRRLCLRRWPSLASRTPSLGSPPPSCATGCAGHRNRSPGQRARKGGAPRLRPPSRQPQSRRSRSR